MNKYHIVVYFSDKINFETYIDSQLNIKEFRNINFLNSIFIYFHNVKWKYC